MNLSNAKNIFFLGIGGIGMSALARYFVREGKHVSGYDKTQTALTDQLVAEGIQIHYEDDVKLMPDQIDLVIYTPAVPIDNREYQYILEKEVPLFKRSQILGLISQDKRTIAIAGTHGKTTTSSILTWLLSSSQLDISSFVGGIMKNFGSNYVHGQGDWVVVEADEYDRSFLTLRPEIGVILSMDSDHLDIYGDRSALLAGFQEFTLNINTGGTLWLHDSLKEIISKEWKEQLINNKITIQYFGITNGDVYADDIRVENSTFQFSLVDGDTRIPFTSHLPGRHNISNSVVCIAIANRLGLSYSELSKSLSEFKGIKRRFEYVYKDKNFVLIDDYAHHPSELKAAISAVREIYGSRKLTLVFQPHLYSRTKDFAVDFAKELSSADEIILAEIYPAREKPIPGVTSQMILDMIDNENKILLKKEDIADVLLTRELDIVLITGAGDIDVEVNRIKEKYCHV